MKRYVASASVLALLIVAAPAFAQRKATIAGVPEIPITSSGQQFLKPPPGESLGESVAVATNSKGDVFVYHRSSPTAKLWQFDKNGNFIKEIGKNYYGFEFSHSVRVDKDDNIWTVDEGTNMVTKFDPNGKFLMVLGRRPPAVNGATATRTGPNPPDNNYTFCRPTDVGWDPAGNIFVSDGYCNNRVVKYSPEGRFLAKAGSEKAGNGPGEFNLPHGMQVDGKNYLVPVDAKLAEATDLPFETIEIDKLLDSLGDPGHTNIILLDACRDNPLARGFASRLPATRSAAVPAGLAAYSAVGTGTLIAYATAPGQTALDGQGANSPFTTSLLPLTVVIPVKVLAPVKVSTPPPCTARAPVPVIGSEKVVAALLL